MKKIKILIDYSDGSYSFTRLDFLGKCDVNSDMVHEVDALTVECWQAINKMVHVMQDQLKNLDNARVDPGSEDV